MWVLSLSEHYTFPHSHFVSYTWNNVQGSEQGLQELPHSDHFLTYS